MVQAHHGSEALCRDVLSVGCGNHGVGVGRVADNQNLDVVCCVIIQCSTLRAEDLAVGAQQCGALLALAARLCTDQEGGVGTVECLCRIIGDVDASQKREGGVKQLHGDAFGGVQRRSDLQQVQLNRGLRAENRTAGNAEEQGVSDLSGGAGNCNLYGSLVHFRPFSRENQFAAHSNATTELAQTGAMRSGHF